MKLKSLIFKLIYIAVVLTLYGLVFHRYAPADVTQGLWLKKPLVILTFAIIFTVLLVVRIIKVFVSWRKEKRGLHLFLTLFLLPFYAFVSIFMVLVISGFEEPKTSMQSFQTNLVYFRDLKIACITGALDDAQMKAGVRQASILFVPGSLCRNIDQDVMTSGKHPYILNLSGGRLGIAYLTDVIKQSGH